MKVGDNVAVMFRDVIRCLSVIKRETANFWVVDDVKYRKADGYEAGTYLDHGYHIKEATKDVCDRYQKDKMIARLKQQNWENFSTGELTDIVAIVCGFADKGSLTSGRDDNNELKAENYQLKIALNNMLLNIEASDAEEDYKELAKEIVADFDINIEEEK